MQFFPQILPGGVLQYPVTRNVQQRVIENITPGGAMYRRVDGGLGFVRWDLAFDSITSEQRDSLTTFFEDCRGTLRPFVFLDPFQNLVRRSESFDHTAWEKEPALVIANGQADLWATSRASRISNATGGSRSVAQRLTIPAWYPYCASCWLRADTESIVELVAHPSSSTGGISLPVTTEWKRHSIVVRHQSGETELLAGLRLPAHTEIYAFGFQLEEFEATSEYKRTEGECGIHSNARFREDELRWITSGIQHHSTRISVQAPILP
ncbi:MAG: hypothetical protein JST93_31100 [Acidobacteria bacterium]|nr:hypothetical protein [Acidobacteriota bacterium]